MKVAVIGGGWYGCHIASVIKAHGAEVCLMEKQTRGGLKSEMQHLAHRVRCEDDEKIQTDAS
jgi:pyruvate/2-oxoglutarate dehydrogenase complex dihydrolipoamide dehydrogenase (E3) component